MIESTEQNLTLYLHFGPLVSANISTESIFAFNKFPFNSILYGLIINKFYNKIMYNKNIIWTYINIYLNQKLNLFINNIIIL